MTDSLQPLALYPFPVPDEVRALLVRAKESLDLPYKLVPVPAVPGGPTYVLSFMAPPPFVCECAIVVDPNDYEAILEAMKTVLRLNEGRVFGTLDYLKVLLGEGVREISEEELRREQFPLLM